MQRYTLCILPLFITQANSIDNAFLQDASRCDCGVESISTARRNHYAGPIDEIRLANPCEAKSGAPDHEKTQDSLGDDR